MVGGRKENKEKATGHEWQRQDWRLSATNPQPTALTLLPAMKRETAVRANKKIRKHHNRADFKIKPLNVLTPKVPPGHYRPQRQKTQSQEKHQISSLGCSMLMANS